MPTEKVRLAGAAYRSLSLSSGSSPLEVTVELVEGEDLPAGELYGTATSRAGTVDLTVADITGSDGVVAVQLTLDPVDFESFGNMTWAIEFGVLEEASGGSTAHVLFSGSLRFSETVAYVIASTTVTEAGSS